MKRILLVFAGYITAVLSACAADRLDDLPTASRIANPASEHCIERGGELEIRRTKGGEIGICHFIDGSVCEEWSLLRDECRPGVQYPVDLPSAKGRLDRSYEGERTLDKYQQ
jgi:uncharacterized protein